MQLSGRGFTGVSGAGLVCGALLRTCWPLLGLWLCGVGSAVFVSAADSVTLVLLPAAIGFRTGGPVIPSTADSYDDSRTALVDLAAASDRRLLC